MSQNRHRYRFFGLGIHRTFFSTEPVTCVYITVELDTYFWQSDLRYRNNFLR